MSRRPTAAASPAASSASASSRPTSTIALPASATQASLEPKPARRAVIDTAPGMCASSNCSSVRTSTTSAPACSTWRGVSGCASGVSITSGPRLSATMLRKFGGCGPRPAVVSRHELVLVLHPQQRLVRALEADRRGHLEVHAGPAAERAAEVAGPQLGGVGQREQLAVQRAEDPARALLLVHGQVGPGDVAHEQAVAGEHRPRLLAALRVDQRERAVLGAVARRVQRAHAQRAELELPAVVERLVVVVGRRVAVDVDARAGGGDEPAVAGDVVGVVVGLEHVLDADAQVAGQPQVLVDVEPGVDDGGHAGLLVADQVARASEVVVGQLPEDHDRSFSTTPTSLHTAGLPH